MRCVLFVVLCLGCCIAGWAQCAGNLSKIFPQDEPAALDDYGGASAIHGEYAVVGASMNDSLAYNSGVVYVYRNDGSVWRRAGIIVPPAPGPDLRFGVSVDISSDYIVVGATASGRNPTSAVYIYRKPVDGWRSTDAPVATFTAVSQTSEFSSFGFAVDISDDQSRIAISDFYEKVPGPDGRNSSGAVYVYKKGEGEWHDAATYTRITPDLSQVYQWFGYDVQMNDNHIFIGSNSYGEYLGGIAVYAANAEWTGFERKVTLRPSNEPGWVSHLGDALSVRGDRLVAMAMVGLEGRLFFFEKGNEWGERETEHYSIPVEGLVPFSVVQTDDQVFVASHHLVPDTDKATSWLHTLRIANGSYANVIPQSYNFYPEMLPFGGIGASISSDGENLLITNPRAPEKLYTLGSAWFAPVATGEFTEDKFQRIYEETFNASDHWFGYAFASSGNNFFVTAPGDSRISKLGGVSVYKRTETGWNFKNKIVPPFGKTIQLQFGTGISAEGRFLAVSASQYYSRDPGGVFIYETNDEFDNVTLRQVIRPFVYEGGEYIISHEVALNKTTLAVALHNQSAMRSSIGLFEFNGTEFILQKVFDLGRSAFAGRKEIDFSFHNDILAVGCITSSPVGNALPGNVFIFERDGGGRWVLRTTVYPSAGSTLNFGTNIVLNETNLFVGDCTRSSGGVAASGGIVVYPRPVNGWTSTPVIDDPVAIIQNKIPVESEWFGYNFDVVGNTIAIGAIQGPLYLNPIRDNFSPGTAYVMRSTNSTWTDLHLVATYSGTDEDHPDSFGSAIALDQGQVVIGAYREWNEHGGFAGAVYIADIPTVVDFEQRMCVNEGARMLTARPAGGQWSGNGMTSNGLFDPAVAGVGTHAIQYAAPNCSEPVAIEIVVSDVSVIEWVANGPEQMFCPNGQKSIELRVNNASPGNYEWSYKGTGEEDDFEVLDVIGPGYNATQPGTYRVKVGYGRCATATENRVLLTEDIDVEIREIPPVCKGQSLQLNAVPAGGVWTGPGVTGGTFDSKNIIAGTHQLQYTYTSPQGCVYSFPEPVTVSTLDIPKLSIAGKYCLDEPAIVNVVNPVDAYYSYYIQTPGGPELIAGGQGLTQISYAPRNKFTVTAAFGPCIETSAPVSIPVRDIRVDVSHNQIETLGICYDQTVHSEVLSPNPAYTYRWYEKKNDAEIFLMEGTSLEINRTGSFRTTATYGICSDETDWYYLEFLAQDSLVVNNVFTPNGDNLNDVFQMSFADGSERDNLLLSIFSRSGRKIFETTKSLEWNGGNESSAVYYWILEFRNCTGRNVTRRGWVHLVR